MRAVAKQVCRALAIAQQERDWRQVSLGSVTARAGEHEVVAAVVGRLAAARSDVIERHH